MKKYMYQEQFKANGQDIEAYRVENDINGNPRYVIHFLQLVNKSEQEEVHKSTVLLQEKYPNQWISSVDQMFALALKKAKKVGGQVYRAKWFGGGIVFQSYNIKDHIEQALKA